MCLLNQQFNPQIRNSFSEHALTVTFSIHTAVAPGAYRPEDVNLNHAPSFSFGEKFNLEKPNSNPGELHLNACYKTGK